jgi:hypothetical protein
LCCTVKDEKARIIKTKKQVWKKYQERKRDGIQETIPVRATFFAPV